MMRLARGEIYLGRHSVLDEILSEIDQVGPDDVLRVASSVLSPESQSLGLVGPLKKRVSLKDLLP